MTFTRVLRAPLLGFAALSLSRTVVAQAPPTATFPADPAPSGSAAPAPGAAPAPPSSAAPTPPASAAPAPGSAPAAPPAASPAPSVTTPVAPAAAAAAPATSPAPAPPPAAPAATAGDNAPAWGPSTIGGPPPDDAEGLPAVPIREPITFETHPGWAVELGARGGIGALASSDARGAFAFGGGFLRGRYRYYEIGGFFDKSDTQDSGGGFMHFGGFAGAWLPYHNWVDFELALAFGSRQYKDTDPRYGTGGYKVGMPALSFIAGVSDRAHGEHLGGRVGVQFVVTGDFNQQDKPWTFMTEVAEGQYVQTAGVTHVGGVSAALVLTLSLDYGSGP